MIVGGSGRAVILAIADAIGNSAVERRIALASAFRKECAGGVDGAPLRATAAATSGFATRCGASRPDRRATRSRA